MTKHAHGFGGDGQPHAFSDVPPYAKERRLGGRLPEDFDAKRIETIEKIVSGADVGKEGGEFTAASLTPKPCKHAADGRLIIKGECAQCVWEQRNRLCDAATEAINLRAMKERGETAPGIGTSLTRTLFKEQMPKAWAELVAARDEAWGGKPRFDGRPIEFGRLLGHSSGEYVFDLIPRPSVLWFAERMEQKLRVHDDKPGWIGNNLFALLFRLNQELVEFQNAMADGRHEETILEAADIANFAMMIAENAKEMAKQSQTGTLRASDH